MKTNVAIVHKTKRKRNNSNKNPQSKKASQQIPSEIIQRREREREKSSQVVRIQLIQISGFTGCSFPHDLNIGALSSFPSCIVAPRDT